MGSFLNDDSILLSTLSTISFLLLASIFDGGYSPLPTVFVGVGAAKPFFAPVSNVPLAALDASPVEVVGLFSPEAPPAAPDTLGEAALGDGFGMPSLFMSFPKSGGFSAGFFTFGVLTVPLVLAAPTGPGFAAAFPAFKRD